MCSTRSASVSTCPYIIVAVVEMPRRCASRITPSHSAVFVFFGAMILRTRSTRISRAAAGQRVEPGVAQPREHVATVESFERRAMCWISGGESACRWIG